LACGATAPIGVACSLPASSIARASPEAINAVRFERLIAEDRVDYVAAADYTSGSLLRVVVRGILGRMSLRAG